MNRKIKDKKLWQVLSPDTHLQKCYFWPQAERSARANPNSSYSILAPPGLHLSFPLHCIISLKGAGGQWNSKKLNYLESTTRAIPEPCLLPAESAPSAGTLWLDVGAGSLTSCTWAASSWFAKNVEHNSDSRAWSFSKEFCQQKQNIRPAKVDTEHTTVVCSSHWHLSPAPARKKVLPAAASAEKLVVPVSDGHYSTCSLSFCLI